MELAVLGAGLQPEYHKLPRSVSCHALFTQYSQHSTCPVVSVQGEPGYVTPEPIADPRTIVAEYKVRWRRCDAARDWCNNNFHHHMIVSITSMPRALGPACRLLPPLYGQPAGTFVCRSAGIPAGCIVRGHVKRNPWLSSY